MSTINPNNPFSSVVYKNLQVNPTNQPAVTTTVGKNDSNAEEIAAIFSASAQDKKNKQKKLGVSNNLLKRINRIEEINALASVLDVKTAVDQKSKQVLNFAKTEGLLQSWTDDEKEKGVEPAETFLALKAALLQSDDRTKPEIEKVIDNFTRENGTSIQTSFNVAATVSKAYDDQSLAQTMRKTIGEGNQNNYDVRSIVDMLLKHFGEDDFDRSFVTYSKSIVVDMKSLVPSTDPKKLCDVFDNLHAANGVRSLVCQCDKFLVETQRSNQNARR